MKIMKLLIFCVFFCHYKITCSQSGVNLIIWILRIRVGMFKQPVVSYMNETHSVIPTLVLLRSVISAFILVHVYYKVLQWLPSAKFLGHKGHPHNSQARVGYNVCIRICPVAFYDIFPFYKGKHHQHLGCNLVYIVGLRQLAPHRFNLTQYKSRCK